MHILLVEDDPKIGEFLFKGLCEQGYNVELCTLGTEARELVSQVSFDLIILDIMLPDIDGIQLTKLMRFKKILTPILILSALSEPEDKIHALDSGADDYLVKPFHFKELLSRINAIKRRIEYKNHGSQDWILSVGKLVLDLNKYEAILDGEKINLSPKEFKLLSNLMENKNKVLSRTQILNSVWGLDYDNHTNVVDVYISYLRSKLAGPAAPKITTIKGVGYMIEDNHAYT